MKKNDFENALMQGHEDYVAIRIRGNEYGDCGDLLVKGHQFLLMHVTGSINCGAKALELDQNAELTILAKCGEKDGAAIITCGESEFSTDSDILSFTLITDFSKMVIGGEFPPKAHLMILSYRPDKGALAFRLIDSTDNRWQWETLVK